MDWYRYSILTMGFLSLSVASTGLAYPTPVDFDGKLQRWSIDREGPRVTFEVLADDTVNLDSYRELAKEVAGLWSSVPAAYVEVSEIQENETAMISIHYDVAISGGDT